MTPRFLVPLFCVLFLPLALRANLVYYLPFDDGSNPSLQNDGSAGGTATSIPGADSGLNPAPSGSTSDTAPNIGSAASEYFYSSNNSAGAVILPSSTTNFRLTNTSDAMTIYTWVQWGGSGVLNGIVNTSNSTDSLGWSLRIMASGAVQFQWTNSNNNNGNVYTTQSLASGEWTQVAMTWNANSDHSLAIYINGEAASLDHTFTGIGTLQNTADNIMLGNARHNAGVGSASVGWNQASYLDDFAMWDELLTAAKIRSLTTAPVLLNGYDAGIMNSLFNAYDSQGSQTVDGKEWNYAEGFDVTGHALGDTWESGDGKYYVWLGGDSLNALGLQAVPEPTVTSLALAVVAGLLLRRRARL